MDRRFKTPRRMAKEFLKEVEPFLQLPILGERARYFVEPFPQDDLFDPADTCGLSYDKIRNETSFTFIVRTPGCSSSQHSWTVLADGPPGLAWEGLLKSTKEQALARAEWLKELIAHLRSIRGLVVANADDPLPPDIWELGSHLSSGSMNPFPNDKPMLTVYQEEYCREAAGHPLFVGFRGFNLDGFDVFGPFPIFFALQAERMIREGWTGWGDDISPVCTDYCFAGISYRKAPPKLLSEIICWGLLGNLENALVFDSESSWRRLLSSFLNRPIERKEVVRL